ncbi:helix-turn-helix domain-containing protein [Thalassococcus lentus]|uniref:Short-chain fatty acyl-CoA regulator family protein n=1 Tax=Thalassococcus lentus TaxID=1210524 RepID=A0ABT4XUS9_9RHOB|nr:XRE family transcriptional regulator [Thalassococcus lentus]MDA7425722.1 short-chain fatty acyl-CoA regulator family protein [Thalassococcus lentus]
MSKTLVGPQLRQLRRQHGHTQAEMAKRLGISPAYVNLLENNQRSLSVAVLLSLTEHYGIDMRTLVTETDTTRLAELRAAVRDPIFIGAQPDLAELRAAQDHAPVLVSQFLDLYQSHRSLVEQVKRLSGTGSAEQLLRVTPETSIHDYFRDHGNHFPILEETAEALRTRIGGSTDDIYTLLKRELRVEHGILTEVLRVEDMSGSLRLFDEAESRVQLSEALDHPNRIFQLAHVLGLVEAGPLIEDMVKDSALDTKDGRARLLVELTNYFAAALLMPYAPFLKLAKQTRYDVDRVAAAFGVSAEQVCHRLTTLQRDGARGVPFFFLRLDRAGNVTKRFNATPFTLAEEGGACPVWNVHSAFRSPGSMIPQFVELPDGGRFFTLSRTSDRPAFGSTVQDRRLVIAIGCEVAHLDEIGYASAFDTSGENVFSPIGINCHVCPRQACAQRAHQPLHMKLPIDTNRRGGTRYES